MIINLDYDHTSGNICIKFNLYNNEKAFAVGFGETKKEANKTMNGWIDRESKLINKRFLCEKNKNFVAITKKMDDGKILKSDDCVDILSIKEDVKKGDWTIKQIYF